MGAAALILAIACPVVLGGGTLGAQEPLEYRISFPDRAHHEARMSRTVPDAVALTGEMRLSSR